MFNFKSAAINNIEICDNVTLGAFSSATKSITKDNVSQAEFLNHFSKIDDYDIITCIKVWTEDNDKVISKLSEMLINRKPPKTFSSSSSAAEELCILRYRVC